MFSRRSVLVLVLAGVVGGCQAKLSKQETAAMSAASAAEIRERYQRLNPKNRVGVVTAVKADANLVAVGEVAVADFGVGDVMTFITPSEEPFNTGVIVNATADALHLRYESGKRAPREGDLAVRLAQP